MDIETNGKKKRYGQSAAIFRYVGKISGLYPTDDVEAMEVDMLCDHIEDSAKGVSLTVAGSVGTFISDTPWTKEEVLAMRSRMLDADKSGSIPYVSVHILMDDNLIDLLVHSDSRLESFRLIIGDSISTFWRNNWRRTRRGGSSATSLQLQTCGHTQH